MIRLSKQLPLSLIVLTCGFLIQSVSASTVKLPSPELEKLPNGLQVAWFLDQKLPVIDLGLLITTGTKDDPAGQSGLALLTASALERGAGTRNQLEFSRAFESLGGSFASSVDEDAISIAIHGLSTDTTTLLDLLADSVLAPQFNPQEITRVQEQERAKWEHLGDSVESLASFGMARWMSRGSAYSRGSLYSLPEWSRLKTDDVKNFYQKHFKPHHAILMVVGKGDRTQIRAQIEKRFGPPPGTGAVWFPDSFDLFQEQIRARYRKCALGRVF
ncbi:MAG: insulinase family protein [Proteobacteria bacterium]|nr:MAG: insulinase family protein [Pseudomonadota bacterium]